MSKLIQKLPEKIWPGQGTACLISDYVTDSEPVKDVTIHTNANVSSSTLLHLATEQIDDCCAAASPRSCLLSGYTSLVRFPAVSKSVTLQAELRAEFSRNHSDVIDESIVELIPQNTNIKASPSYRHTDTGHRVVICMACWEPDPERFQRQVDSIRAQSMTSWHCIINDDASSDES